jgi:hypothetical protein
MALRLNAFASLNIDLFSRFDCTRNVNLCRGFLIDGDCAIKWREFSSSQSISVCGWNCLVSSNTPDLRHVS